ncbi:hypothetical protein [Paraflavitalea speifideaquila]|uniref:hypothetical protein n=1 Tax=Paraflavitalea speifideaquila TaxID=3076558 RepID=UPI0028EABB59|nr:hypothetical protein [Paraflavitalea speifideiaquila]
MPYLLAASAGQDAALPLLCCFLLLYRQGMVARCSGGKEQGSGPGWRQGMLQKDNLDNKNRSCY